MTNTKPTHQQKRRLRAHFGFSRLPFSKFTWAKHMYDSTSQRELLAALSMWTELRGFSLVIGQSGVGKSITLRRFVQSLDDARFRVFDFSYLPVTVTGFLRSLSRTLGLTMRHHAADLFDAAQAFLASYEQEHGPHPILLIDDAEGLSVAVVDVLRRLTCHDLDTADRFSILLSGTEGLLQLLRNSSLESMRSRIVYAEMLRPFSLEDTQNYVRHHLERAEVDPNLFTDEAIRRLFQASLGRPRNVNQIATQALIQAAVRGRDKIDGDFLARQIGAHPLYQTTLGEQ